MIPDWMVISAFRYCLGRATYIVGECTDWLIEHRDFIDLRTRDIIAKEIYDALDRDTAGMDIDRCRWREVLEAFE